MNLEAIHSQKLVPDTQSGRIPACELLIKTARSSDLLKRGDFSELQEVIEKDVNNGMQTLDQSLYELYQNGKITPETALQYADSVGNMRLQMRLTQQASH